MQEKLDVVLRKLKIGKLQVFLKYGKRGNLMTYCNAEHNQNIIDRWTKDCILPFPKKGDLRIAKNY